MHISFFAVPFVFASKYEQRGLDMNLKKMKMMVVSKNEDMQAKIKVNRTQLEQVQ